MSKIPCLFIAGVAMFVATMAFAQVPDAGGQRQLPNPQRPATQPATRPAMRNITSPDIAADGRVTIRIIAPKAADVSINGDFLQGAQKLTKDDTGLWSITL